MFLTQKEIPILIFNLIYIPIFTFIAWKRSSNEFLLYVAVIFLLGGFIVVKQKSVQFPRLILWGLSIWGLIHMAGGLMPVGDKVLYEVILIPLVSQPPILRFDQVVHFFGFGVATMACHHLLQPYVRDNVSKRTGFWLLVVLMGCGLGAANEMVEFAAVLCMRETGVGGYDNTMLDLVFNFLGAMVTTMWLAARDSSSSHAVND